MELIQEIGSYAGLAAVIGLAVLSALYFSQARDVRRLRDWAGRAPERTTEPAAQPTRVVARPVPRAPGAGAAAAAAGAAPAAATGPAAATPAAARAAGGAEDSGEGVSQDTMAHPPPGLDGDREEDLDDDEVALEEPDDEDIEETGDPLDDEHDDLESHDGGDDDLDDHDDEGWEDDEETGDRPAVAPPVPEPAPAGRPAAPARPVPPRPRPVPMPPRAAPATPAGARPAAVAASSAERSPSGTVILPPYERSRPGGDPWYRRLFSSPARAAVVIGVGVLILAGATLAGMQLAGGDDEPSPPSTSQPAGGDASGGQSGQDGADTPQPAVDPADVTVAVLNGTTVTGLAARVGDTVEAEGYQLGNITNSSDQERAESVVLYAAGAEAEAEDVSRRLDIPQREQIDPAAQGLAGDASVVVVVGADKT